MKPKAPKKKDPKPKEGNHTKETGGIKAIYLTDIDGKEFKRYDLDFSKHEEPERTFTLNFTINRPTKPYWELFGYKTEADMLNAQCWLDIKTGYCYRHHQHANDCLNKKNK